MRNKKNFSFNEETDAENIITNGFKNNIIDNKEMYSIAKYFREKFGYGEIRLERELIRFCKTQDKNFNPIIEADELKKWIKSAMTYNLRKIESVMISQKEIDFLKTIENTKDRKILFCILILSKALKKRSIRKKQENLKKSNNYYIRYNNFSHIINLSEIPSLTEIKLAEFLNKYKEYFSFYSPEKELIRVEYVDKDTNNGIIIDNLDRIIDFYEVFFGKQKPVSTCARCGKRIIKNSNKQKYCKECYQEAKKLKNKFIMRKIRNSVVQ